MLASNSFSLLGYFYQYLENKSVLILSLSDDPDALVPFSLEGKALNDNMKLLHKGDLVGVTGSFVKGSGKFCRLKASRVTFLQGEHAGKEVS